MFKNIEEFFLTIFLVAFFADSFIRFSLFSSHPIHLLHQDVTGPKAKKQEERGEEDAEGSVDPPEVGELQEVGVETVGLTETGEPYEAISTLDNIRKRGLQINMSQERTWPFSDFSLSLKVFYFSTNIITSPRCMSQ